MNNRVTESADFISNFHENAIKDQMDLLYGCDKWSFVDVFEYGRIKSKSDKIEYYFKDIHIYTIYKKIDIIKNDTINISITQKYFIPNIEV